MAAVGHGGLDGGTGGGGGATFETAIAARDGAALVGTSGNYVLECAYDVEAGARGESDWFQIIGDALGPHTGYVRDVVATRDGRRAWSCACNFAPRWNASGDGGTYEPTSERVNAWTRLRDDDIETTFFLCVDTASRTAT